MIRRMDAWIDTHCHLDEFAVHGGAAHPDAERARPAGARPKAGAIGAAGQVARYRFRPATPGLFAIRAEGVTPLLLSVQRDRDSAADRLYAAEGSNLSMTVRLTESRDYFVAVRHAKPLSGTGEFRISVRPAS